MSNRDSRFVTLAPGSRSRRRKYVFASPILSLVTGAFTLAQDEASSVVFGMPKEAIKAGAADRILPLSGMAAGILEAAARKGSGDA